MNKDHIFLSNGRVHIKEISGTLNSGRMVVRIAPDKIPCSARVATHHQLLWTTAQLLIPRF